MTDGYVERRRDYIAQIRSSFDTEQTQEDGMEEVGPAEGALFVRMRFLLSAAILIGFLFLKMTGTEIYGYQAKDFIDIISDNHYYTNLQDYVMIHIQEESIE